MKYNIQAITKNSHTVRNDRADSIEELLAILQELKKYEYDDNLITVTPFDDDEIAISWHIDDVKSIAEDLTDEQCRRVLQLAKDNHDATIGINWDTLEYWADYVRENEPEE